MSSAHVAGQTDVPHGPRSSRSIAPAPTVASREWPHALLRASREPARVLGFVNPATHVHQVVMPTSVAFTAEAREMGTGRWRRFLVKPGELMVTGAGAGPSELCWQSLGRGGRIDIVEMFLEPAALGGAGAALPTLTPQWHLLRDPLLGGLLTELGSSLAHDQSHDLLFGDVATTLFALQLGRAHADGHAPRRFHRGGLAAGALKRVREFIAAHVAGNLRLRQLADVAGLSPSHFCHAFKVSTGLSPHAYVVHCRIEEAKRLLAGSALPIAEIARRSGFKGAGQLSTRFRASTNTTPSSFRRLVRR